MDSRGRDRREYLKEWRRLNKNKIQKYEEGRQINYANYSATYRKNHPEKVLWSMAKRRSKSKNIEFNLRVESIEIPIICPILGIPRSEEHTSELQSH